MSLSAGAVNLALLLLTCVGGRSSTCPAVCRCEADGTLQSVDCDGAGLRSVPSNLSSFTSALRLAGNCLSQINGDAFTVLTGLTLLNLQNNQLRTVPSEALKNLKNLRSLRVTQLQALTLDLNAISTVPDRAFASLGQLLVLDLSFNRINRFPSAIRSLSRLRDLNLQNNNILVVPSDAFSGNPSLRTINIRNNRLHTVQLQPEPQHLYVSMVTTHLDSELQDELCCRGTGHEDESLSPGETEDREETEDRKETEDREDSGSLSLCCLDVLHFIFIISIIFNLLVLLSLLLLPSSPTPLPPVIFWLRLLTGLSGSALVQDPDSVLVLSSVCSHVCVLVLVWSVLGVNPDQDQDQDRYPGQPCDLLQPRPHPGCHGDRSLDPWLGSV
ncbi:hypothetical protein INR49_021248 [Caranx melampygus]|nr:hypothetical protein INR49_021248 [Caranx melampygus]